MIQVKKRKIPSGCRCIWSVRESYMQGDGSYLFDLDLVQRNEDCFLHSFPYSRHTHEVGNKLHFPIHYSGDYITPDIFDPYENAKAAKTLYEGSFHPYHVYRDQSWEPVDLDNLWRWAKGL